MLVQNVIRKCLNKKKGAKELKSIYNFMPANSRRAGFRFTKSAGLEAKYNDHPEIRDYRVGRNKIHIYSNIYLSDSTYTLKYGRNFKTLIDLINIRKL